MGLPQPLLLDVEVVEIFEGQDDRLARVRIEPHAVLDLAVGADGELHLGDRLVVDGWLVVSAVVPAPERLPKDVG